MALSAGLSWSRRLTDRYIMFGLACMFLCVSTVVLHAWTGSLVDVLPPAVTVAFLILLAGGVTLRRTVRFHAQVEDQLWKVAQGGDPKDVLAPLPEPEPAAAAWNSILQRLEDQRVLESLEARLSGSLGSVEGQRWRDLFNVLSDGLAVCDGSQKILQSNNALAAMLNQADPQSLPGQDLLDLIARLLQSEEALAALDHLPVGGAFSRDVQLGNELGAGVLRVSRIPLVSDAFGPGSSLWSVRDVTQQRLADEMRSHFLSTATHELRTPLTNIMAYAELLAQEDDLDVEKQKAFCNIINSEATRLSRFVDQMLNVSQMQAGALSLTRFETDLQRLVSEVLENVQPQAVKKQLHLDSQIPPKLPKMRVDKDKLAAALVNLVGNGVKYTPEGGRVKLTVEVSGEQIQFHVDDTGIGIAADELPRISERFFRSSDARVRGINGSGLGLAFAQEVAKLHGGQITVTSELNKGSRFTLTLPLN